jgi:hypothetical protein
MDSRWADFYVTIGSAAAALTGLLFVAVALRPREIRNSPMMVGRARSAFYAFITVLFSALLALFATSSRLIGLAQFGIAIGVLALSGPYTARAWRARSINYRRAVGYHAGLIVVAVAGAVRAVQGVRSANEVVLAIGAVYSCASLSVTRGSWFCHMKLKIEPRRGRAQNHEPIVHLRTARTAVTHVSRARPCAIALLTGNDTISLPAPSGINIGIRLDADRGDSPWRADARGGAGTIRVGPMN